MRIIWRKRYHCNIFWGGKKNHCSKKRGKEKDICQTKMFGFILSFWTIRTLLYSCRVTSKAQLGSPNSVVFNAAIDPFGGSAASLCKPKLSAVLSEHSALSVRPPQVTAVYLLHFRKGIISEKIFFFFFALKYTVTFVPQALVTQFIGITGDRKRSI